MTFLRQAAQVYNMGARISEVWQSTTLHISRRSITGVRLLSLALSHNDGSQRRGAKQLVRIRRGLRQKTDRCDHAMAVLVKINVLAHLKIYAYLR